jgi:neopullulanase
MLRRYLFLVAILSFAAVTLQAQRISIDRVEPLNWWVGFENPEWQILVYGVDISSAKVSVEYPGVTLKSVLIPENPNYVFLNLVMHADTKPGSMKIHFNRGRHQHTVDYELKARSGSNTRAQGFDASDVIYLIMPDRFANGDPSNDNIQGMLEQTDRSQDYGRHGGDLKGVLDNLGYIKDLGMTAIWLNPIFENDMPANYEIGSGFYHGYAATDMYKVDRRFGTNEEFRNLVETSQSMGMKVIMDMIHNHVGTYHWFIKDMPSSDWVHDQSKYGNTNYRTSTIMDPYASERDRNSTIKGWFVDEMPDLDQRNQLLSTYLIQNTIWWIEYSGIDGIRMDTHPYPYKEYMADWTYAVLKEFPDFNIVGEAWMPNVATTAFWQYEFPNAEGYNSFLPSVTDFPLYYAVNQAFMEEPGWDTGVAKLYYTLSQDFLYSDPYLNVIFLDNHDLTRYFTTVGEDVNKFKMGLAFILTSRGIPQIYYGTEILKAGGRNDPDKRRDFPGGWKEDPISAFTESGRIELGEARELPIQETFEYVKNLVHWRNQTPAVHFGKLTHFVPEQNVYVYFRYDDQDTIMVVINASYHDRSLNTTRFNELTDGFVRAREITTGTEIADISSIEVPAQTAFILHLKN